MQKKYIYEQFAKRGTSFRWSLIVELIEKYKVENPDEITVCTNEMYDLLMQRENTYSWQGDGANDGF